MALTEYKPFDDWLVEHDRSAYRVGVSDDDDEIFVSDLDGSEIELINAWRDNDYAVCLVMIAELL